MNSIYDECPLFQNEVVTLRLTGDEDTLELLNCYSDEKAVPLFNSDNCNGDDFYYTTKERMQQEVDFWKMSFENKYFVRMTIILNKTNEKIGTIEMFNRGVAPNYGIHGVLRIDLMSKYEKEEVIEAILELANKHFYQEFGVEWIMTKAIESAKVRREVLVKQGYTSLDKFDLDDYYGRVEEDIR